MSAFDRVPQHDDELGVGNQRLDVELSIAIVEVERRGLALERVRPGAVEQRFVVGTSPDVLTVGLGVTRTAFGGRRPIGKEEFGLLDRRHVNCGMLGQRQMQGRGTGLGDAGDEELWKSQRIPHPVSADLSTIWRVSPHIFGKLSSYRRVTVSPGSEILSWAYASPAGPGHAARAAPECQQDPSGQQDWSAARIDSPKAAATGGGKALPIWRYAAVFLPEKTQLSGKP